MTNFLDTNYWSIYKELDVGFQEIHPLEEFLQSAP